MLHFTITLEFIKYGLTLYRWGWNVSGKKCFVEIDNDGDETPQGLA